MKKIYLSLIMLLTLAVSASAAGRIYVYDKTGWDALNVYAWADGQPELFGAWTGAAFTATEAVGDYTYKYVDVNGTDGVEYNLIFNNGSTQFDGPKYKVGETVYLYLTASNATNIADKSNPENNKPEEVTQASFTIKMKNSTGWNALYVYSYTGGDNNVQALGGWPGTKATAIDGNDGWYYVTLTAAEGLEHNLIFNNGEGGEGNQVDAPANPYKADVCFEVKLDGPVALTEGCPEVKDEGGQGGQTPTIDEDNLITVRAKKPADWRS